MKPKTARFAFIDGLKVLAIQFILMHHLAAYGPFADEVQAVAPDLISWLYDYARMAVQVFLVAGGYLAARALSAKGAPFTGPLLVTSINRYLRLALPFIVSLVFAIACSALARQWMDDDEFVSAAPTLAQWLAHLVLLQGILGYESLNAGVWYVAIDLQLFVLLTGLLWLGRQALRLSPRLRHGGVAAVIVLAAASLFWLNRNDQLDNWAPYFFGSYALGVLAYWAGQGYAPAVYGQRLVASLALVALLMDFRWRILVALGTAMFINFSHHSVVLTQWQPGRLMAFLGRSTYALFLVHVPIYVAVTAIFVEFDLLTGAYSALIGMGLTWGLSLWFAGQFHRWVEVPLSRIRFAGPIQVKVDTAGSASSLGLGTR